METVLRLFHPPDDSYFLFGPRGTGKSTWLKSYYPDAIWVNLLNPDEYREFSARPERLRNLLDGRKNSERLKKKNVLYMPVEEFLVGLRPDRELHEIMAG
jgi:predicted AAA+ superfamily ATPase